MTVAVWAMLVGLLLISMALVGTLLSRLPLSAAMIYLLLGWVLGPQALDVLRPDPFVHASALEQLTEIGLLISLFGVGLQLAVPLRDARWRLPMRLAFVSMAATVGMITVVGLWFLDLSVGAAILLGAILAPTDPVLASDVRSEPGSRPDRVGFSLAGEGGLNDGAAYPFVMLGLGLLGLHELGAALTRWWLVDLLWATLGGVAIGALLGAATGRLVVHLRSRHAAALGLDVFLSLGLIGIAYGLAQLCLASGFLSVFAAGLALRRVQEQPQADSATMRDAVQSFNEQLERLAELALVLVVGAMLAYAAPAPQVWWFVPLLLLVIRPISAALATVGEPLAMSQRALIGWFGIRGIGSVFYLMFALHHGLGGGAAEIAVSLTLWSVASSIIAHGVTAQPFMEWYESRRRVRAKARAAGQDAH